MKKKIYLDHAATTPVLQEVIDAMKEAFSTNFGNPSSLHTIGQQARDLMERSRECIANNFKVDTKEIIFTGSGTESDNLAIQGTAFRLRKLGKGNHIITSVIEHSAVLNTFRYLQAQHGFRVTEVPVDQEGILDLDALQDAINSETIFISVMYANNEIGTIQPIKPIGDICEDKGIIFHTDAVQAFGKIPIDPENDGFHLLSASAHKIYGPKGIGLLYMRDGGDLEGIGRYIQPIIQGGGHERGYRSATENVPGIVGFAKAVELAFNSMKKEADRQTKIRDKLIDSLVNEIPGVVLNGHKTRRLPNNVNICIEHVEGESMLIQLDMAGYEVSTGSACSSKSLKPSHVLLAIGRTPELAHGSLRITLGLSTTEKIADDFVSTLKNIVIKLREISPLFK
ncbi:MAG: cysteine desulfurase family protein [Promethearchaeota archaeon]